MRGRTSLPRPLARVRPAAAGRRRRSAPRRGGGGTLGGALAHLARRWRSASRIGSSGA
ncbi:UNVERIFIED_ORG: hypothetical protein QOE_1667, partial [Clostridioides difficile F501]